MRKIFLFAAIVAVTLSGHAQARDSTYGGYSAKPGSSYGSRSDHSVKGYTRSNGTYVQPSHATNPDVTKNNNYSTKGNVNPYTGKLGTKSRDGK